MMRNLLFALVFLAFVAPFAYSWGVPPTVYYPGGWVLHKYYDVSDGTWRTAAYGQEYNDIIAVDQGGDYGPYVTCIMTRDHKVMNIDRTITYSTHADAMACGGATVAVAEGNTLYVYDINGDLRYQKEFNENISMLAAARGQVCAVLEDRNTSFCYNRNTRFSTDPPMTYTFTFPRKISDIAISKDIACFLLDDGTVECKKTSHFAQSPGFSTPGYDGSLGPARDVVVQSQEGAVYVLLDDNNLHYVGALLEGSGSTVYVAQYDGSHGNILAMTGGIIWVTLLTDDKNVVRVIDTHETVMYSSEFGVPVAVSDGYQDVYMLIPGSRYSPRYITSIETDGGTVIGFTDPHNYVVYMGTEDGHATVRYVIGGVDYTYTLATGDVEKITGGIVEPGNPNSAYLAVGSSSSTSTVYFGFDTNSMTWNYSLPDLYMYYDYLVYLRHYNGYFWFADAKYGDNGHQKVVVYKVPDHPGGQLTVISGPTPVEYWRGVFGLPVFDPDKNILYAFGYFTSEVYSLDFDRERIDRIYYGEVGVGADAGDRGLIYIAGNEGYYSGFHSDNVYVAEYDADTNTTTIQAIPQPTPPAGYQEVPDPDEYSNVSHLYEKTANIDVLLITDGADYGVFIDENGTQRVYIIPDTNNEYFIKAPTPRDIVYLALSDDNDPNVTHIYAIRLAETPPPSQQPEFTAPPFQIGNTLIPVNISFQGDVDITVSNGYAISPLTSTNNYTAYVVASRAGPVAIVVKPA